MLDIFIKYHLFLKQIILSSMRIYLELSEELLVSVENLSYYSEFFDKKIGFWTNMIITELFRDYFSIG